MQRYYLGVKSKQIDDNNIKNQDCHRGFLSLFCPITF